MNPLLLLLSVVVLGVHSKTLISTVVVARHGARTPVRFYPGTKSKWPEGPGQLTRLGIEQHFELGQRLSARYGMFLEDDDEDDDNDYLNEDDDDLQDGYNHQRVHVQSTNRKRTLQSAGALAMGVFWVDRDGDGVHDRYPNSKLPGGVDVVPVHAHSTYEDTVLYAYKNCPIVKDARKRFRSSLVWESKTKEHAALIDALSKHMGFDVELKHCTGLHGLDVSEQAHNRTSSFVGFSQMDELASAADWVFRRKFYGFVPELDTALYADHPERQDEIEQLKRDSALVPGLIGGNLVRHIFDRLSLTPWWEDPRKAKKGSPQRGVLGSSGRGDHELGVEPGTTPRLTLLVAHDGTILSMFAGLGLGFNDFYVPNYASFVTFDRYDDGSVEVRLDEFTLLLSLDWDAFSRLVKEHAPYTSPEEWRAACGGDSAAARYLHRAGSTASSSVFVAAISILFVVWSLWYSLLK